MLFWLAVACSHPTPPVASPPPAAPTLEVDRVDRAGLAALLDGEGPALVALWATWCGPCAAEMPTLLEVAAARPDAPITLVSVDHPRVDDAALRAWVAAHDAEALGLVRLDEVDGAGVLATTVPGWADALPTTVVLTSGGPRTVAGVSTAAQLLDALDPPR